MNFLELKSTSCETDSPCWFCSTYDEYNDVKANTAECRNFFQKIVNECPHLLNPTEWNLGQKTKKGLAIPENAASKIHWMNKPVNFVICNINNCKKLVSSTKRSKTSILAHIDAHLNEKASNSQAKMKNSSESELPLKDKMNLIIALKMIGQNKMSAFKATSPGMISTYRAIIEAAGVKLNEDERLCGSRKTVMKTAKQYAENIRTKIKEEIAGRRVTLIHDDSSSSYGTLRAVTATFVKNRKFQRRFLHMEYVQDKDAKSITDTLLEVAEKYDIQDFEIAADGASTNRRVAKNFNKLNHTCWSHTVHLIVQLSFTCMESTYPGFKKFYQIFTKFVEKFSRKHLNSTFSEENGFVKIPSLAKTRWLSRRNCLNAIVKNWEILMEHKSKLGLTPDEFEIFNNLPLFEDLKYLVNVAAKTLLRFEIQKATTSHLVLPVLDKWIRKNLKFKITEAKTQLGRHLVTEINKSIDIYLFGKGQIDRRIRPVHVVQSVLSPIAFMLKELRLPLQIKNSENIPTELSNFDEINESLNMRYKKIENEIMPSLEAAYTRLFRNETESSESDSSQPKTLDLSGIDGLTQEQISQISNMVQKNESQKEFKPLRNEFKKFKRFVKEFYEWEDNITGEAKYSDLIRAYNAICVGKTDKHMLFWSMNEVRDEFPILYKIAYESIHIPASSCAVESLFSHVTDIKTFRRSKLQGKQLNDILTLFYSDLYMEDSYTSYFDSVVNKKIDL